MKRPLLRLTGSRIRVTAILFTLLFLLFGHSTVSGARRSDQELFQIAHLAYKSYDYLRAAMYLTAYVERDPPTLQNAKHAKEVFVVLEHVISVVNEYKYADQLRNDLRACQYGGNVVVQGLTAGRPELNALDNDSPDSYPLICRGGTTLSLAYVATSQAFSNPQLLVDFSRASQAVGQNKEFIGRLTPGQCSWLDRSISSNEPSRIVFRDSQLHVEDFAILWSGDNITRIVPSVNIAVDQQVAAVARDMLQSGTLWTFQVYNDRNGSLNVTSIVENRHISDYIPLFVVTDVSSNDTLNIRSGPSTNYSIVGRIPYNGQGVERMGSGNAVDNQLWLQIRFGELVGWVNSRYLKEQRNLPANDFPFVRTLHLQQPPLDGLDVRLAQRQLTERGYTDVGPIDGWFGSQTQSAVMQFQRDSGLEANGRLDLQTWNVLFASGINSVARPVIESTGR